MPASPEETFLAILSRKGEVGRILREMHDLGFLGRYVPEFGALTVPGPTRILPSLHGRRAHSGVHRETRRCPFCGGRRNSRGYRALFQNWRIPPFCIWPCSFMTPERPATSGNHEDASAVLAQKVARRLQLSPERRRMLITLVNSHYELSFTAQKRNLDDPATIAEFGGIVGNRANLDALMLLTLADGQAPAIKIGPTGKRGLSGSSTDG